MRTGFVFLSLTLMLAACAAQQVVPPTPPATVTMAPVALPTLTIKPAPTVTATQSIDGDLLSLSRV